MHNRPLAAGYCQLLGRTEVAMKASDVVIGGTYVVKVSDKLAKVRIASAHASGKGWVGKNLETGRQVRIKSPQRLRAEVKDGRPEAPTAPQGARVAKKPEGKSQDAKDQPLYCTPETGQVPYCRVPSWIRRQQSCPSDASSRHSSRPA